MKFYHKTILALALLSCIITAPAHAELQTSADTGDTIIFFPFENYTGSDMKYLAGYIPELMKKNFNSEKNIRPVTFDDIKDNLKNSSLAAVDMTSRDVQLAVMNELGIATGVRGRYLVQGQTIVIETGIIRAGGGDLQGDTFEAAIDDKFFKTLKAYCEAKVLWIRSDIFSENIHASLQEHDNISFSFIRLLKDIGLSSFSRGWILALIVVLFFYLISVSVSKLLIRIAVRFTSKTETQIDDLIIDLVRKPLKFIIIMAGFRVALYASGYGSAVIAFAAKVVTSLIIITVAYIASGVSAVFVKAWGDRLAAGINPRINNDLVPLFVRTAKVVIFSVVFILVLSNFNIDVAPLVASLGIAGFAIGFAVKDTLSNIIGGIILMLDSSFSVGDKVTVDSDTGIIMEVGLRNTKILTYDNELIIIPNGELMNKKFKNYVLPDPTLRVVVNFSVAYGSDVDLVRLVVLEAIKSMKDICEEPVPVIEFSQMGDFSLNFNAKFWIPDFSKYHDKMLEGTDLIYRTLMANNIDIPFPTNTVYLKQG